jgi:alpha-tubulin suppressor-like RCC1 family protein
MSANLEPDSSEKSSVGESFFKELKGSCSARKPNTSAYGFMSRDNRCSEVFVWGSNSSFQLGEAGADRHMCPKLANSFSDVESVR